MTIEISAHVDVPEEMKDFFNVSKELAEKRLVLFAEQLRKTLSAQDLDFVVCSAEVTNDNGVQIIHTADA